MVIIIQFLYTLSHLHYFKIVGVDFITVLSEFCCYSSTNIFRYELMSSSKTFTRKVLLTCVLYFLVVRFLSISLRNLPLVPAWMPIAVLSLTLGTVFFQQSRNTQSFHSSLFVKCSLLPSKSQKNSSCKSSFSTHVMSNFISSCQPGNPLNVFIIFTVFQTTYVSNTGLWFRATSLSHLLRSVLRQFSSTPQKKKHNPFLANLKHPGSGGSWSCAHSSSTTGEVASGQWTVCASEFIISHLISRLFMQGMILLQVQQSWRL